MIVYRSTLYRTVEALKPERHKCFKSHPTRYDHKVLFELHFLSPSTEKSSTPQVWRIITSERIELLTLRRSRDIDNRGGKNKVHCVLRNKDFWKRRLLTYIYRI